jgi:hypothetical protein
MLRSVEILPRVTNEEYDQLLSENVVFLRLLDCAAVNTVLECAVRATPLVVNRHPALEEVLGKDYPGFYDEIGQAYTILSNATLLRDIHRYLRDLDRRPFDVKTLLDKMSDIIRTWDAASS